MLAAICLGGALAASAPGADRIEGLHEHGAVVRSIRPDDDDFSDLEPLARAIGESRVVFLGENTHGDGATFSAKTRLVKFLHQTMGFDVLAWESGMFDVRGMQEALRSDMEPAAAAQLGLYRVWSASAQMQPLFEYLKSTQGSRRPLLSAGFDARIAQPAARAHGYPAYITGFFDKVDPALIDAGERERFKRVSVALVPADYRRNPRPREIDPGIARELLARLEAHRDAFARVHSPAQIDFVRQTLAGFIGMSRALTEHPHFTRDTAMARNLIWLAMTVYPDRKIIVWTHNFHAMMSAPGATRDGKPEFNGPTGRLVRAALGDEVYAIGFVSWGGRYGYVGEAPVPIPPARPGCLESALHALGHPYLFLDGRGAGHGDWLRQPRCSRLQFHAESVQDWTRFFDALFYIDIMEPANLRPPVSGAFPEPEGLNATPIIITKRTRAAEGAVHHLPAWQGGQAGCHQRTRC
jgi:erythromycin esterase